ncbi:MAG: Phosphate ABC transporter, periplasmic phosphate-binding protein PstS [uncultured Rubrobacteraceae bacterium]|uniref:Phosphate-binding protein n=1 Tax=uncultured Rubrobacteraceae bacterium TaxID=349277 RepID=A0A6J4NE46_9ACTN|nr:MAG: Phosphate ABC transporter, periplasmic phosphate-binding protein PstS [uncultured Rubrobacteraceae bacterium]
MSGIMRARFVVGTAMVLALSLVVAACGGGGGDQGGGGGEAVSGEITIEGSSTVQPISQAAAELFREENPEARIQVGGAGTSDGFEAFCQGDTQISDASRPIDVAEEVPVCEENGVEFIEIPVAFDGISVVVNSENDFATDVTTEELKTMWEPAAEGEITQWSQVRSEWPDEEISLYGPGTESGTYEFFNEAIVGNEEEVSRQSDVEMSEDDNVLVQGVAGDQNALGYFGYSYYENNRQDLKALALDGVEPSAETIRSGDYGLSRPLFIYVSVQALENNAAVQPFVDFYLSEQNLNRLVEAARYVTLPSSLSDESRAQYEDRTTGTVFTEEGEPKGGDLEGALQQAQ